MFVSEDLDLRSATWRKPDDAELAYAIGTVLKHQGKLSEAALEFKQCLKFNPDHEGAQQELGALSKAYVPTAEVKEMWNVVVALAAGGWTLVPMKVDVSLDTGRSKCYHQ